MARTDNLGLTVNLNLQISRWRPSVSSHLGWVQPGSEWGARETEGEGPILLQVSPRGFHLLVFHPV